MKKFLLIAAVGLALPTNAASHEAQPLPMSDPDNSGGWVLNPMVSDEFNADEVDHEKWNVQGRTGYNGWKGRAPSQYVAENVFVEDGKLKIRSKWEPDYDFFDGKLGDVQYGDPIAPVTTGGVISNHRFRYGYMEARTKAADAAMTSAWWTLGYESELDMYEQMGRPKQGGGGIREDTLNIAIHDWRPGKFDGNGTPNNKVLNFKHDLGFRVADDFHVYGVEWDPEFLRFFVDGKLVGEKSREEIGDGWVLTNGLQLYFDSEIFSWLGYPHAEQLPADYEIDYVRVWQKPTSELLDGSFFGFEGPLFTYGEKPPGEGANRVRNKDEWREDWYFHGPAKQHFSVVENEQFLAGKRSLKFTRDGKLPADRLAVFSPYGSVDTEAGDYIFSLRVFVPADAGSTVVQFMLDEPWYQSPQIDLGKFPRDQWVNLPIPITRGKESGSKDRLRMFVVNNGGDAKGTYYFDEFSLKLAE